LHHTDIGLVQDIFYLKGFGSGLVSDCECYKIHIQTSRGWVCLAWFDL